MMAGVVVTGMGVIGAPGIGVPAFSHALLQGISGARPLLGGRLEELRVGQAAAIESYDPLQHFTPRELAALDPFSQYALVAAREAVAMAGLEEAELAGSQTAVILGTGIGGYTTIDQGAYGLYALGNKRVDVMSVPRLMPSASASQLSMRYHTTGPSFVVTSACASATQAIGIALSLVRAGVVQRALVGGSEACITYSCLRGWEALRVLTPEHCRPFARNRSGMLLGEGGAIFVIEDASAAKARGAEPMARLSGYGTTSDGDDILRPNQNGCAGAMKNALADAALTPADIGYINAHGTGTIANDSTESAAICDVFGSVQVPVSSTKPVHGHALGAAGALELVAAITALREQKLLPNLGYADPDPECAINVVTATTSASINHVLSNSFAFGGINASLIVSHPDA